MESGLTRGQRPVYPRKGYHTASRPGRPTARSLHGLRGVKLSLVRRRRAVGLDTNIYGVRKEWVGELNFRVIRWLNGLNGPFHSVRVEP
eukprot:1193403-Prorocentrum_minimum.AAC.1